MNKRTLRSILACVVSLVMIFSVLVGCTPETKATITLDQTELTIGIGDAKILKATTDSTEEVKWSSSDDTVATVSNTGRVQGVKKGTATITAAAGDLKATCSVTVQDITVKISDTAVTLERGTTKQLTATVQLDGKDMAGETVNWTSEKPDLVSVDKTSGLVTAIKETTEPVPITAKRVNGSASATCQVTVVWTNKPDGYYELAARNENGDLIDNGSIGQNKVPQGRWAYWGDQAGWNNGNADFTVAEYQNATDSMAGTVHVAYTNGSRSTNNNSKAPDTVQITFRSIKSAEFPNGLLETGKYYKLTAEITVDFEDVVTINGTETLLHKGKNNIEIWFHHTDDGVIHGDTDYDIYQFPAFYMVMGSYKEDTFVTEADITITKLQWTEFTAEALKAPTVAISDGKVTVTANAENAAENVDGYEIGFFATADAQTPKYTVKAQAGEATTIKSDSWDNGTYTVKARALSAKGNYTDSPWSEAAEATYTVEHEALVYDLPFSASADITADGWYYWNELGEKTEEDAHGIVEAKYDDGTLTYEFSETKGNWYSQQLFFCNTSLSAGTYQITFTMTSSVAGEITVNNTKVTFTDDALTQQVKVNGAPGQMMISIQFGVNPSSAIEAGRFTITDIEIKGGSSEQPQPQPGTPTTPANPADYQLGEKVNAQFTLQNANKEAYIGRDGAEENKFAVWHTAENGWDGCGTIVTMNETKIENNALTISYTGGSVGFSVQLYYNNASITEGKQYFLSMKINASELYTITINGVAYTLAAGDNNVALVFTKGNSGAMQALDVQFPGHDTQLTFVISDVAWQEVTGTEQPAEKTYTPNDADLVIEGDKVYFLLKGAYAGYTEAEIKEVLDKIYFDFQGNQFAINGSWDGNWESHTFERKVTVTATGWEMSFDITDLSGFKYTAHFDSPGSNNPGKDLKVDNAAINGRTVTLEYKTFTLVNVPGSSDGAEYWGCIGLVVTDNRSFTLDNNGFEIKLVDGKPCLIVKGTVVGYTEADFSADVQSMNDNWPTSTVTSTAKIENGVATITIDLSTIDISLLNGNGDRCLVHIYADGKTIDAEKTPKVEATTEDGTETGDIGSVEADGKVYKANFRAYWEGRQMLILSISDKA